MATTFTVIKNFPAAAKHINLLGNYVKYPMDCNNVHP
jgi:hypothetical protein